MNKEEQLCVPYRFEKEGILHQPLEILETDPFHRRHDIPSVEQQNE
jgi:hypothetical protein